MADNEVAINHLRIQYPWPSRRPEVPSIPWVMDYGGRELIMHLIRDRDIKLIIEIGAFVGGSVRQWLYASSRVIVIAIDPWPQIKGPNVFYDNHPVGRVHADQLRGPDGLYLGFLASLWQERERVIPVRGTGEKILPALHAIGLRPDLIFIDADKSAIELKICDDLFQGAIVCGDDWLWSDGKGFPSQRPVQESAHRRGRILKCVSNTWLIDDRPWSISERWLWLSGLPTSLRRRFTAWRRALWGLDSSGTPGHG